MIKLIVGTKGTGKTKTLIEMAKKAAEESKGNVVCVEKAKSWFANCQTPFVWSTAKSMIFRALLVCTVSWQASWQATMTSPTCSSTAPSKSARLAM